MSRLYLALAAGATCAMAVMAAAAAQANVKEGVDAWQAGNYAKAIQEWRGPADAGDADAQFNLAQAYKLGRGVPTDLAVAQGWYQKAAEQGHEQAQANLGLILFQNGDRRAAMPWIEKAAGSGEPRAQYVLGTAMFNGDLAAKDWPRAYAMMTRAAAAGLPQAVTSLAEMDRYIPMDQRQRGVALARQMPDSSVSGPITVAAATAVPAAPVAPPTIRAVPVPASAPPPPPPPVVAPVVKAAVPPARPAPTAPPAAKVATVRLPAPPKPQPLSAVRPPAPVIAPALVPAAAAIAKSGPTGGWRVQLGAFGTADSARQAWGSFAGVHGLAGLRPSLIPAGAFTRLQAGPLASKAAAAQACAAVRIAGKSCFPVAP